MTYKAFTENYRDKEILILLEGKRTVKEKDREKLVSFGRFLAEKFPKASFRSGNAAGADSCFSKGVAEIAPERLQAITPYEGHRKNRNYAGDTVSLDQVDLLQEPEVIYQSKTHKSTSKLVDKFVDGAKDRFAIKAAYIIRDTVKVLGTRSGLTPIDVAFFYEDYNNPESGGTGHTMRVCRENGVPFMTQKDWMEWPEH